MTIRFHPTACHRDGSPLAIILDDRGVEHGRWAKQRKRLPWLYRIRFRNQTIVVRRLPWSPFGEIL